MKKRETSPNIHLPNNPSKLSKVLNQPCPEKILSFFQEPSVKHHIHGIDGKIVSTICDNVLCSFNICASTHSVNYVSAILSVSIRSISRLLKILLFLSFQMYHSIYANWWSSICGKTLQNRWSMFMKRELVEKIVGFDGIFERAQFDWWSSSSTLDSVLMYNLKPIYKMTWHRWWLVGVAVENSQLNLFCNIYSCNIIVSFKT